LKGRKKKPEPEPEPFNHSLTQAQNLMLRFREPGE
jgi:hypothetical protein